MAKILVIEDSPDILEMIRMVLENYGHEMVGLSDKFKVKSVIAYFNPDLILLDLWVGNRLGREICRDIKTTRTDLPVILMSTDEKLLVGYETCYANDVIAMPFDISKLKDKIEKAVSVNTAAALQI